MAEDVTLGLAGILGESTNLKPISDKPFTRAAQQELTLGLKAKADEAKLAAEKAKVEKEYANIIKPPANVDKIGADRIQKITIEGLQSGEFKTQMGAMLGQQKMNREVQYSNDFNKLKESADKILLTEEERTALKNDDFTKLKKLAEIPDSNITWDKVSDRPVVKHVVPDVDLNAEYKKNLVFGSDVKLDKTTSKSYKDENGHLHSALRIAPEVVDMKINSLFNNPDFAQNYLHKNKEKVAAELPAELAKVDANNPDAVVAAHLLAIKNAVKKELEPTFWKQVDIKDVPKASGDESKYRVNSNGDIIPIKGSGFTGIRQADGSWLLNTGATSGITEQNMTIIPDLQEALLTSVTGGDAEGSGKFRQPPPEAIRILPTKSNYLGDGMWEVVGEDKVKHKADTKSMQSFFGNELVDKMLKTSENKKYVSGFHPYQKPETTTEKKDWSKNKRK